MNILIFPNLPIHSQSTLSLLPKNIRKPYGFPMFSGVGKGCIGNEWVKQPQKQVSSLLQVATRNWSFLQITIKWNMFIVFKTMKISLGKRIFPWTFLNYFFRFSETIFKVYNKGVTPKCIMFSKLAGTSVKYVKDGLLSGLYIPFYDCKCGRASCCTYILFYSLNRILQTG